MPNLPLETQSPVAADHGTLSQFGPSDQLPFGFEGPLISPTARPCSSLIARPMRPWQWASRLDRARGTKDTPGMINLPDRAPPLRVYGGGARGVVKRVASVIVVVAGVAVGACRRRGDKRESAAKEPHNHHSAGTGVSDHSESGSADHDRLGQQLWVWRTRGGRY